MTLTEIEKKLNIRKLGLNFSNNNYRVSIPKDIVKQSKIQEGDYIQFKVVKGKIIIEKFRN